MSDDSLPSDSTVIRPRFKPFSVDSAPQNMRLIQLRGPGAPREFILAGQDQWVVGRSTSADIYINSPEVSRKHMIFKIMGHEFRCIDLDSRNGIFLNRLRIHSAVLCDGDQLQVGEALFLFQRGEGWASM